MFLLEYRKVKSKKKIELTLLLKKLYTYFIKYAERGVYEKLEGL